MVRKRLLMLGVGALLALAVTLYATAPAGLRRQLSSFLTHDELDSLSPFGVRVMLDHTDCPPACDESHRIERWDAGPHDDWSALGADAIADEAYWWLESSPQSAAWCQTARRRLELDYASGDGTVVVYDIAGGESAWADTLARWFAVFPPTDELVLPGGLAGEVSTWSILLGDAGLVSGPAATPDAAFVRVGELVRRLEESPLGPPPTVSVGGVRDGSAWSVAGAAGELDELRRQAEETTSSN